MQLKLNPTVSEKMASIEVADAVFAASYNEPLVFQALTSVMSSARFGNKANKSRSAVRGGGRKPWRQKGTGRARAGTNSSPLWRGGGVTFAARPRSYEKKINKKMYRNALCSILSELVRLERLIFVDEFVIDQPSTKMMVAKIKALGVDELLIVTDDLTDSLYLSARNVPKVEVICAHEINPYSLIGFQHILMTQAAVRVIEQRLL